MYSSPETTLSQKAQGLALQAQLAQKGLEAFVKNPMVKTMAPALVESVPEVAQTVREISALVVEMAKRIEQLEAKNNG